MSSSKKENDLNNSKEEELFVLVYDALRQIAAAKIVREPAGLTLQPTALVHEAWLRLGGDHQPHWQNKAHFFSSAAEAMRRILIDEARKRKRLKHGGDQVRVTFEKANSLISESRDDWQLIELNEALEKFAQVEPEKAELVKLRYFIGLTVKEAAQALSISTSTAKNWWMFSRAWLFEEIAST